MSETTSEQLAEIEGQADSVQVCEGRWRTRGGMVRDVTAMPTDHDDFTAAYPWWDGDVMTWANNGAFFKCGTAEEDLVEYLGPLEQNPQPQPQAEQIEELRSEVSYVQRLLGESRQRVTHLEQLVGSLRTINETQEKAFTAAGKENTALRNQLAAVKSELASIAADRQRLRVELDAAQQVPADSPELRQLRADLKQVTLDRDTYRDAHESLLKDANTVHERTKAMTVEAIAEWLEPIRLADSAYLANATMRHLPSIMRTLTGLNDEEIE